MKPTIDSAKVEVVCILAGHFRLGTEYRVRLSNLSDAAARVAQAHGGIIEDGVVCACSAYANEVCIKRDGGTVGRINDFNNFKETVTDIVLRRRPNDRPVITHITLRSNLLSRVERILLGWLSMGRPDAIADVNTVIVSAHDLDGWIADRPHISSRLIRSNTWRFGRLSLTDVHRLDLKRVSPPWVRERERELSKLEYVRFTQRWWRLPLNRHLKVNATLPTLLLVDRRLRGTNKQTLPLPVWFAVFGFLRFELREPPRLM